jgi:hypothetical protein
LANREAGEARGEAEGWGLAIVPRFEYWLKLGPGLNTGSNRGN